MICWFLGSRGSIGPLLCISTTKYDIWNSGRSHFYWCASNLRSLWCNGQWYFGARATSIFVQVRSWISFISKWEYISWISHPSNLQSIVIRRESYEEDFSLGCGKMFGKENERLTDEIDREWYTVCGKRHSDYHSFVGIIGALASIGITTYSYALIF